MKTATTVIGTAGIVALNKWSSEKPIEMKSIIAVLIVGLVLAMITEVDAGLAEKLGTLIFVTALLMYGPRVIGSLGFGVVADEKAPRGLF